MTNTEVALLGLVIALISSMITLVISMRKSISKEDLDDALRSHVESCRQTFNAVEKSKAQIDKIRNGRLDKLEAMAATKEDIHRLEESIAEVKALVMKLIDKLSISA